VPLPAARQTPNLEDQGFRVFQLSPQEAPASKATLANPAAEGGTMGEKWSRILPKVANSTPLLGSFTCRKARHGTDGFTSPPMEGVLRIFFARKIRRLRPGLNPRTWVPKASTLTQTTEAAHTLCYRMKLPHFGRTLLMLNYMDVTIIAYVRFLKVLDITQRKKFYRKKNRHKFTDYQTRKNRGEIFTCCVINTCAEHTINISVTQDIK
jgi:hypothetical protein